MRYKGIMRWLSQIFVTRLEEGTTLKTSKTLIENYSITDVRSLFSSPAKADGYKYQTYIVDSINVKLARGAFKYG